MKRTHFITTITLTASLLLLTWAAASVAAEGVGKKSAHKLLFIVMDADKDGKISRTEFKGADKTFTILDKNGDGFIEESEQPTGDIIADFDRNGDNKVSRDEFPGKDKGFSRLDQNNDGYIDATEAAARPPLTKNGRSNG